MDRVRQQPDRPYCAKDFDERDWTVHAGGKSAAAGSGTCDATEKVST